jgi:hypothetical protein
MNSATDPAPLTVVARATVFFLQLIKHNAAKLFSDSVVFSLSRPVGIILTVLTTGPSAW